MRSKHRGLWRLLALLFTLTLVAAACGNGDDDDSDSAAASDDGSAGGAAWTGGRGSILSGSSLRHFGCRSAPARRRCGARAAARPP